MRKTLQHNYGNVLTSREIQEPLADHFQLRTRKVVTCGINCDGEQEIQVRKTTVSLTLL